MSTLWKINCVEDKHPGLWQRWFRNQSVAVGWASAWGFNLHGETRQDRGWPTARNAIKDMEPGDYVVVALKNNRVGRIGQITGKAIGDDEWDPLVPKSNNMQDGEMGRRIFVRWELTTGPDNQDLIIELPKDKTFNRGELRLAVARIRSLTVEELRAVMDDQENWVSLLGKFNYEKSLSDYIANYPGHLEEDLLPYPDSKVRENVFKDGTRSDVLLVDREGIPVVVECKQCSPSTGNIGQLRGYMKRLKEQTGRDVRGILVHGGAQKISTAVIAEAKKKPQVEIVSYRLNIDFRPSYQ